MAADDGCPDPHDDLITPIYALGARSRRILIQELDFEGKSFFGMIYTQQTLPSSIR